MTYELGARAPKYQRIADELRREIRDGTYPAGERLPAETALLDRFRAQFPTLSLPTLRQAIGLLRSEGLIESRHGVGTFVTTSHRLQRRSRKRYGRARSDRQLLTSHLDHTILFAGHTTAPGHISDTGAFSPGEEVIARRRLLRDKDTGRPEELGVSYVPLAIGAGTYLEQTDVVPQALFLCIEELSSRRYTYARDQWTVRAAGPDESDLLNLASPAHVVHLIHTAYDQDDNVMEVSESVWPSDRVLIIDEYAIPQEPEKLDAPSDV
jgi:GntR family transcriptional regulator